VICGLAWSSKVMFGLVEPSYVGSCEVRQFMVRLCTVSYCVVGCCRVWKSDALFGHVR